MTAPRLFALVARAASVAVVFRRGPSRQVLMLTWDLARDIVTPGQWLKGKTYPRRADLSPDGRHLIYLAMDGRWSGPLGGSWTAVSRPPCWTALHLYPWGHCWNGGGLFADKRRYWLNGTGAGPKALMTCGLKVMDSPPAGVTARMGEDAVTYLPRLIRDGWTMGAQGPDGKGNHAWVLTRPVARKWALEKTFLGGVASGPNREAYSDHHRLIGPEGAQDIGAEWADVWKGQVLFARDGGLWRIVPGQTTRQVADLSDLTFRPFEAPYAGVDHGDLR